jgi:hypothetical protein
MRQAVVYGGEDEYWIAECPSLPGRDEPMALTKSRNSGQASERELSNDNITTGNLPLSFVSPL